MNPEKRLSIYIVARKIDDRVKINHTKNIENTFYVNCFTEHLMLRLLNWIRLPNGGALQFNENRKVLKRPDQRNGKIRERERENPEQQTIK